MGVSMDGLLTRFAYLPDATYGRMRFGDLLLATVEDPWVRNPNGPGGQAHSPVFRGSCIPDGVYTLEPHNTVDHPNVWALVNPLLGVYHYALPSKGQSWGRVACLIHLGNTTKDVEGCIAVGDHHGTCSDGNLDCVLDSRIALGKLQQLLGKESHRLTIAAYGGTAEPLEWPG